MAVLLEGLHDKSRSTFEIYIISIKFLEMLNPVK